MPNEISTVRCLLIDDEPKMRDNMDFLIRKYCPELEVCGQAASAAQALELITTLQPDAIFLDIQMPGTDGFSLLSRIPGEKPLIVFVTAHEHYALKAIKASAVDYLLKPVSIRELKDAAGKLAELKKSRNEKSMAYSRYDQSVLNLLSSIKPDSGIQRIALPSSDGFRFEELRHITRLESDSNYTRVYMAGGEKVLVSKTMKHFEEILDERQFLRVHNSHLVNADYIKAYHREDGGTLEMTDGTRILISKRKLPHFLEVMKDKFLKLG